MLRTWVRGRRGAVVGGASVVAVCLGAAGVVALDGGDGRESYVAVGAAGGAPSKPGSGVAPTGKVRLVPLDPAGAGRGSGGGGSSSGSGAAPDASTDAGTDASSSSPDASSDRPSDTSSSSPAADGPGAASSTAAARESGGGTAGKSPGTGGSSAPAGPAALKVGEPVLKGTDQRWCQDVTLKLVNSGGTAVRSGTVTFRTHVIGALGVDWATVVSTQQLPVPIGAGEKKEKTWTVCVDSWRVPLGMHVETRDVDVQWK
ncbi:hypothetical protein [Streptomyces sp. NPDC052225]|uniref:hypothetical protein n=1 Tax=Streptomyces sp. NPDC052225 TaxID=3154949 RepID=UPI00342165B0